MMQVYSAWILMPSACDSGAKQGTPSFAHQNYFVKELKNVSKLVNMVAREDID